MLKHHSDTGECDSGKHRALTTGFKKYAPAGGGGRSIRRREGKPLFRTLADGRTGQKQTNSDRRAISGDTALATSQTAPSKPLRLERNSIASVTVCRAGRRRGVPARRSGRATAATRKRRADRCG